MKKQTLGYKWGLPAHVRAYMPPWQEFVPDNQKTYLETLWETKNKARNNRLKLQKKLDQFALLKKEFDAAKSLEDRCNQELKALRVVALKIKSETPRPSRPERRAAYRAEMAAKEQS